MQRTKAIQLLESLGGRYRTNVSGKTDFVIVGGEPGKTKIETANQKGIPTIGWPTLVALGFLDERPHKHRLYWAPDITATILIQMAILVELLYVKARDGDQHSARAAVAGARAVEELLCAAFGPPTGQAIDGDEGDA